MILAKFIGREKKVSVVVFIMSSLDNMISLLCTARRRSFRRWIATCTDSYLMRVQY